MANFVMDWSYLHNTFDNVTKTSFKRMYIMSTDHFDKLRRYGQTDAELQEIYNWGEDVFEAFRDQYKGHLQLQANYQRYTNYFSKLLAELISKKARRWDILIQVEFDVDNPEYQSLMPNGRKSFQRGAYDLRIANVQVLANQLKMYPELSDLQVEVEDFYGRLLTARENQQGVEGQVQQSSDKLEACRVALARRMHGIFGRLLFKHFENPYAIANYYELKYLRSKRLKEDDTVETPTQELLIFPNNYGKAFEDDLMKGEELRISNKGNRDVKAYLSHAVAEELPEHSIIIHPSQSVVLTVGEEDRMLVVVNEMEVDGICVVEKV